MTGWVWASVGRVLLISGALAFPAVSAAAQARVAANICQLAAPSTATITKDLGKPSAPPIFLPNPGAFPTPYCEIYGKTAEVRIYMNPAAQAATEISGIKGSYAGPKAPVTTKSLSGLGICATLYYYPKQDIIVWFTKGSHFVTVIGYGATPNQTVAIARATGAKLR